MQAASAGHDEVCYCAALRRCSTNCFAGRGSVLKLRAAKQLVEHLRNAAQ